MNINEIREAYFQAIGEFVVHFAILEMHLSKFISAKKSQAHVRNFRLSVTIAPNFDSVKKVNKVDNYINFCMPQASQAFKDEWQQIYIELLDIIDARNFLVHGTCVGLPFYEPIDTFLTEDKENMRKRQFMLQDIYDLIQKLLKIISKLSTDFWHKYAKLLGFTDYAITAITLGNKNLKRPVVEDE